MPLIKYENAEGQSLQGWTTILNQQIGWGKDALMGWANKVGRQGLTMNEARNQVTVPGTIAHYLVECYWREQATDLSQYKEADIIKAQQAYTGFLAWVDQFRVYPIEIEPHLVSEKSQYGFTPDLIAYVLDKVSLIDWKTGKIYENTLVQFAGYSRGWKELHPDMPIQRYDCLRIPRDQEIPTFHHSYWESLPEEAYKAADCALELKKAKQVLENYM